MGKALHQYGVEFDNTSAEVILPSLFHMLQTKSVIDVGCGIGNWLSVSKKLGIPKLLGVDGPHAKSKFLLDTSNFFSCDFEIELSKLNQIDEKFDLAICLEVVEHLTDNTGRKLIDFLTNISTIVLFSAAIPFQTGENHINEQEPSYWQELFSKKGYVFFDMFRDNYWNDQDVKWWYKQNMFLVVKKGILDENNFPVFKGDMRIHPDMLKMYLHEIAELKRKKGLKSKLKKFLK